MNLTHVNEKNGKFLKLINSFFLLILSYISFSCFIYLQVITVLSFSCLLFPDADFIAEILVAFFFFCLIGCAWLYDPRSYSSLCSGVGAIRKILCLVHDKRLSSWTVADAAASVIWADHQPVQAVTAGTQACDKAVVEASYRRC